MAPTAPRERRPSTAPARIAPALALCAIALAAALAGGCGSADERDFTPVSFVSEINAGGAGITLEGILTTNPEGVDVYSVSFASTSATGAAGRSAAGGSGGTLLVLGSAEEAKGEYARCQADGTLTCFRAANAVLRFEQLSRAERSRLLSAVGGLATGG